MSNCCSDPKTASLKINKRANCPECGGVYKLVHLATLLHQLSSPHNQSIKEQSFYFCSNPECNIVYFGNAGDRYSVEQVRSPIGQKQTVDSRLICYCFDISAQAAADDLNENGTSEIKEFVKAQTRAKRCACDIRNPSGKCCLVDFPN